MRDIGRIEGLIALRDDNDPIAGQGGRRIPRRGHQGPPLGVVVDARPGGVGWADG